MAQKLYVPGDNDVGGEGADPRLDWKVTRFHEHFASHDPDMEIVKFIDFIKVLLPPVNLLTEIRVKV